MSTKTHLNFFGSTSKTSHDLFALSVGNCTHVYEIIAYSANTVNLEIFVLGNFHMINFRVEKFRRIDSLPR